MVWLLIGAMSISIAGDFGLSDADGIARRLPLLGGALLRICGLDEQDRLGAHDGIYMLTECACCCGGGLE